MASAILVPPLLFKAALAPVPRRDGRPQLVPLRAVRLDVSIVSITVALSFFARLFLHCGFDRASMRVSHPRYGWAPDSTPLLVLAARRRRHHRIPFCRRRYRHPRHRLQLNVQRRCCHRCRLCRFACSRVPTAADAAPGCPPGRVPPISPVAVDAAFAVVCFVICCRFALCLWSEDW